MCDNATVKGRELRVLSYNIHKGFSPGKRRFALERMREAIRSVHADLVFLQEVVGRHDHRPEPQFEYLADELWPHYAYGRNAVYSQGHHGNAILSKFPFSFWENIDISRNRLEKRGMLHGIIEIPGEAKPLHAICVHLGLLEAERRDQIRTVCERIAAAVPPDEPLVIGGDFNDWRASLSAPLASAASVAEVFETLHGKCARTFPSWLPALRLDRIYVRGVRARRARSLSGLPWSKLSDHLGLYTELELETQAAVWPLTSASRSTLISSSRV